MEAFHVESDRTDLVVITNQEYRELITAGIENKALADQRLSTWMGERNIRESLQNQVDLLTEKCKVLTAERDEFRKYIEEQSIAHKEMSADA